MYHLPPFRCLCRPIAALLAFGLGGCVHLNTMPPIAETAPAQPSLLLQNVRIFSGDASQAVADAQDVLIVGNRIQAIGPHPLDVRAGERIDGAGGMLLPGLIDMHVHVGFTEAPPWRPTLGNPKRTLSAFAAHGVTTVLDLGGRSGELQPLAQQTADGDLAGPRLLYAGKQFSASGSHPAPLMREILAWPLSSLAIGLNIDTLDDNSDIAPLIEQRKQSGATLAKVMIDQIPLGSPSTSATAVRRLVDEAHRRQLPVAAHVGDDGNLQTALNGGVDLVAHMVNRSGLSDTTLTQLQRAGIPLVTTLKIFHSIGLAAERRDPVAAEDEKVLDPKIRAAFHRLETRQVTAGMAEYGQLIARQRQTLFDNCKRMHAAGIPLLVGTDSPNLGNTPGTSIHQELELLVRHCGMNPAEALAAATGKPGTWLGRHTGIAGLGRIQAGAPADLLLVDGDPLNDIRASRNIRLVLANGRKIRPLPQQ